MSLFSTIPLKAAQKQKAVIKVEDEAQLKELIRLKKQIISPTFSSKKVLSPLKFG